MARPHRTLSGNEDSAIQVSCHLAPVPCVCSQLDCRADGVSYRRGVSALLAGCSRRPQADLEGVIRVIMQENGPRVVNSTADSKA